MNSHVFTELKNRIAGEVVVPDSPEFDGPGKLFNQVGSSAVIVYVQSTNDVVTTIRFARKRHLPLSVRSGGHGLSLHAMNNGGLVLDLTHIQQIELLDAKQHLVRIGAGARWGDVAKTLAVHGLAISSGDTNQVGVGGLTLGGGIGWLVRTHGLTIDSLHAAELVTADGRILSVSAEEHPDVFWAIRGGGGNFGVVTSFDFHAHPCHTIVGGSVIYDPIEVETVLAAWASSMHDAPEELNSTIELFSGFGPQVPPQIMVKLCYAGEDQAAANEAIKPFLHLGTVRSQNLQKMPYAAMLEDAVSPPPGLKLVDHGGFLKTLSKEAISVLAANYGKPGTPLVQIRGLGGALARVSPQATAFAHRENEVAVYMAAFAPSNMTEEQTQHIRQVAWRPLERLTNGAYVNFLSHTSEANVAAAYPGSTYTRLARIKASYDPDNIFNQNHNIKPAGNVQV